MKRKIARLLLVLNPVPSARLRHWLSRPKQREREREGEGTGGMCVRSPFRRSAVLAKCDSVIKNQFHNKYLAPARRNLYILSRSGIAKREVVLTHLAQIAEGIRIDKQAASSEQQAADSRQLGKAVRQMKSVVAQLSAIDVAALYHYHIWTESRYLLGTSASATKGTLLSRGAGQMPKQRVSVTESGANLHSEKS